MGNAVKKIGKKTVFSFLSLGAFLLAIAFRLLFGGSHLNISKLDSKANDVLHKADVFAPLQAKADTPLLARGIGDDGSAVAVTM